MPSVIEFKACPQRDRSCLIQHALSKRRPCLIRHALSGIGHASSSMPSAGSVMPHLACPQPDRPRPALSWIALGQPSAGSPCPSCACLSDAPPLELLKVSRHLPSLSPQPPRAPALQAMSACPQSEGELTYPWHSERAPRGCADRCERANGIAPSLCSLDGHERHAYGELESYPAS